jgi:hypothetical protein
MHSGDGDGEVEGEVVSREQRLETPSTPGTGLALCSQWLEHGGDTERGKWVERVTLVTGRGMIGEGRSLYYFLD